MAFRRGDLCAAGERGQREALRGVDRYDENVLEK